MHLNELTIHGFRAFPPEEQTIDFGGDNAVIVGDNGTGKSSVLAAVEFLLTGGMSHLSGPGTGEISIPAHAPHQWADPEDCFVRGEFINGDGERGVVERRANNHNSLEHLEGEINADDIEISQWNDEHLILTRGQLLEFIESAPANRGERLSKLLNLSGVTNRARGFDRIRGYLEDQAEARREYCRRQVDDIASSVAFPLTYPINPDDESNLLDAINQKLTQLGITEVEEIEDLADALESTDVVVSEEALDPVYESRTEDRLRENMAWVVENQSDIEDEIIALTDGLDELVDVETSSLFEIDIFEAATEIVDPETTTCPLCGETHDQGFLNERVESERTRLSTIRELREEIDQTRQHLQQELSGHIRELQEVVNRLNQGIESGDHSDIDDHLTNLEDYIEEMEEVVGRVDQDLVIETEGGALEIQQIDADDLIPDWEMLGDEISAIIEYIENLEPLEEHTATFSDLITIRNAWDNLEEEEDELEIRVSLANEMEVVEELFTQARREALNSLYESIENKFNEFYTTIHPEEQEIDLDFDAEGTESVDLEATFEEERDSPLAYHSEGHIDTMGVCLFLALRDHLDNSGPDIVMLDDIVMSVDKTHRQGVANLLGDYLNGSPQGILATHDEVWSDQLTASDVVSSNNVLEITDWDISTGPMLYTGAWDIVEDYIDQNRPHAAAASLRRQAEKFSRIVAARLRARMDYKERYELADFVFGINRRLREVTGNASDYHEDLSEEWEAAQSFEERRSELLGDVGFQELNNLVHYRRNVWGQLDADELRGVLEHWRDIEDFMYCDACNSYLSYNDPGDWHWIRCDGQHTAIGFEE